MFIMFKGRAASRSLFPVTDPLLAELEIVLHQGARLFLSQSKMMDLAWDARAALGSRWLAAFMEVIECERLKSWHFASGWDKTSG